MTDVQNRGAEGVRSNGLWGTGKNGEQRSPVALRGLIATLALALALVFPVAAGADNGHSTDNYCLSSSCLSALTAPVVTADSAAIDAAAWYDAAWYDAAWSDEAITTAAWFD